MTVLAEADERFCDQAAIDKVRRQINMRGSASGKLSFLVLSASFNPVHTQHVNALIVGKQYIENLGWTVVGGFLAPSSDEYLLSKLGSEAMTLQWRTALCRLAIKESDWLSVCAKSEMSSNWACRGIRSELEYHCLDIVNQRTLSGVEIMSSDVVIRIFRKVLQERRGNVEPSSQQGRRVCCLQRAGSENAQDRRLIEDVLAPGITELGVELMLVDSTPPLPAVSSTTIRELVLKRDWETLRSEGFLHPSVLEAIRMSSL